MGAAEPASGRATGGGETNCPWLDAALGACLTADLPRLRQAVARLRRPVRAAGDLPARLRTELLASQAACAQRRACLPRPSFPETLPVNLRRTEIARAIAADQVVIVCGETGSGKTTQLPKILLDMGRGAAGVIGHTQPRRIAARATAARIAQELDSELGSIVGYKIRFTDRTGPAAAVKLMTDGILLAETQGDPQLCQYDTLIIDEAHERSLNIDFLLGYLRGLLPQRPELKVVVTSATLDAERFARHFAVGGRPAPVIEVSGRLHPIELRWQPVQPDKREGERDLSEAIVDAVDELARLGPGDVLVFLPGEREIREAAEALRKHQFGGPGLRGPGIDILPLFARQSAEEQARVFSPGKGRRVVLATNVAETSLTVPGVRYVVDSGLARVKRYTPRNKVEQLRVEPIAQAAARQRAGRCGRVAAGVCIRLYAEDDFERRPAHTPPEILRASLAGVILRMKALSLGAVEDFPFIDPPLPRMVSDGYQLLAELGAVDDDRVLTDVGRELAKLPVDPKIGRMILAARDAGCLKEVLVIAAALSVQDPRERPQETSGSADQAHARWKDSRSEFLLWTKLWQAYDEQCSHATQRKQREWCRSNYLSYLRMREWRDVHGQLGALAAEHGWRENTLAAGYDAIHKTLLTGLLGHVGQKNEEEGHYLGAHGIKFFPHPGSTLAKKAGRWLVAAELVDTSRLYARCLARIEPEWLEEVGAHLLRRHYYEPHWSKSRGEVMAFERATLHGILLYARRPVPFGARDATLAREIFIREALVQGKLPDELLRRSAYLQHNRKLVADIEALEHRSRRPDVLVDESLIEAFYDKVVAQHVVDVASFEAWRIGAERAAPRCLFLDRASLMRHEAAGITTERFPAALAVHGQDLPLSYHFDPGAADDGVTLTVPLAVLNQVPATRCEWLVPGLREAKVMQLAKTLPQKIRYRLGALDAFAAQFAAMEQDCEQALTRALQGEIESRVQLKLPTESFRTENLPAHLLMNYRVVDAHGRVLGQSRNLAELRSRFSDQIAASFADASMGEGDGGEHEGLTDWSFGELPELMSLRVGGRETVGFPALVDGGSCVALRVFDTEERARDEHRAGLRRLFALRLNEPLKYVEKNLPGLRDMALQFIGLGTEPELRAQLLAASLDQCCMMAPLPSDAAAFAKRRDEARGRLTLVAQEVARLVASILSEYQNVCKRLTLIKSFPVPTEDIRAQLATMLPKDFVIATPFEKLRHLPRYLKAVGLRIDKLRVDPQRDERQARELLVLLRPYERERLERARSRVSDPALEEFRWLLEELRVALFAQELKTTVPVSVKRLQRIWEVRHR